MTMQLEDFFDHPAGLTDAFTALLSGPPSPELPPVRLRGSTPRAWEASTDDNRFRFLSLRLRVEHPIKVAAWGVHPDFHTVVERKMVIEHRPMCLGVTRNGSPRHPLYLPANTTLVPFESKAGAA